VVLEIRFFFTESMNWANGTRRLNRIVRTTMPKTKGGKMKDGMTRQGVIGRFGFLLALLVSGAFLFGTHGKATVAYADCDVYSIAPGSESDFCVDLLGFFNDSITCEGEGCDPLLEGTGGTKRIRKQRIQLMQQLLKRACELTAIDPYFHDVAAILLQTAYERCDDDTATIKDWVRGPAKEELACRLQALIEALQDAPIPG
jgi:hypothetical protein